MTSTTTYRVEGMSCEHCVRAVTAEVGDLDGVTAVDVDLAAGEVTVTSENPLDESAVRAAVDEAGYELVS
ncbi:MAG TPA: copper ion binding protein [Acidimicrobiales bacterium]|nr:copper ion binding protein [Acidimicrobiales bacterium]